MMDRDITSLIHRTVRPLLSRSMSAFARGIVTLVNNAHGSQLLQVRVLNAEDEPADDVEHLFPYGFSSVPPVGAEVITATAGDQPVALSASVRAHRPTGGQSGDVMLYHQSGARLSLLANGNVEVWPGSGGEVYIRSDGGSAERLVKKSEHDNHTHSAGSLVAPGGGGAVTGVTGGAAAVTGTTRLRVQ